MKIFGLPLLLATFSCSSGPGPVIPTNRTERQMIGLLEKFDRWDYNGDGKLTEKELTHGINEMKGTSRKVNYTGKEIVAFYDKNKDGQVTLREAQAGYSRADEADELMNDHKR